MRAISYVFLLWGAHAAIALAISFPIILFGKKQVLWGRWELIALVLPFFIWFLLTISGFSLSHGRIHFDEGKSLSNLIEVFWLGCSLPIAALARIAAGTKTNLNQNVISKSIHMGLCIFAAAVSILTPCLPE